MNGCIFALGERNDILHSALLSGIRNRNEEVYWELFVLINYFVLHLFWLCPETYLFPLGWMVSVLLFRRLCITPDGLLASIMLFKQQYPVKVVAAGLARGKTVVASLFLLSWNFLKMIGR